MGRRRVVGDGKSATAPARRFVRSAAGRICGRLPPGCLLLFLRFSAVGLATDVLHRGTPGVARHLCSVARERVGGLAEDQTRNLEPAWACDCLALETVPLSRPPDDDDELCFSRNSGSLSDTAETCVAFWPEKSSRRHSVHNGWRNCRWNHIWLFVRSHRPT